MFASFWYLDYLAERGSLRLGGYRARNIRTLEPCSTSKSAEYRVINAMALSEVFEVFEVFIADSDSEDKLWNDVARCYSEGW